MATVPAHPTQPIPATESLAARFQRLAEVWRRETAHLSSSTQMAAHPAYQEIIALGEPVVPLLLADLARQPDHWFTALKRITGANPATVADRGRIDRLAAAWLRWGHEHGYQW